MDVVRLQIQILRMLGPSSTRPASGDISPISRRLHNEALLCRHHLALQKESSDVTRSSAAAHVDVILDDGIFLVLAAHQIKFGMKR